mgnify:CR=1 FL=1
MFNKKYLLTQLLIFVCIAVSFAQAKTEDEILQDEVLSLRAKMVKEAASIMEYENDTVLAKLEKENGYSIIDFYNRLIEDSKSKEVGTKEAYLKTIIGDANNDIKTIDLNALSTFYEQLIRSFKENDYQRISCFLEKRNNGKIKENNNDNERKKQEKIDAISCLETKYKSSIDKIKEDYDYYMSAKKSGNWQSYIDSDFTLFKDLAQSKLKEEKAAYDEIEKLQCYKDTLKCDEFKKKYPKSNYIDKVELKRKDLKSKKTSTPVTEYDRYTWEKSGKTYTKSGVYKHDDGCHYYELILTIKPSPIGSSRVGGSSAPKSSGSNSPASETDVVSEGNNVNTAKNNYQPDNSYKTEERTEQPTESVKPSPESPVDERKSNKFIVVVLIGVICFIFLKKRKNAMKSKNNPQPKPQSQPKPEPQPEVKPQPEPRPQPEVKPQPKPTLEKGEWILVGASVKGNGHIESGMPCQDNHKYEFLEKGWGIAIVSDGAGSAAHSEIGSKVVVERGIIHFKNLIQKEGWIDKNVLPSDVEWLQKSYNVLKAIRDDVAMVAQKNNVELKSLSATCLVVIFSPIGLLSVHIGDGRIGCKTKSEGWKAIMTPHKGEEANQTIFLVSDFWNIPNYVQSGVLVPESIVVREPVESFALMTDGCENTAWRCTTLDETTGKYYDQNKPFEGFFNPLEETLISFHIEQVAEEEILEKWSKFIESGAKGFIQEQDDKTMIYACYYSDDKVK